MLYSLITTDEPSTLKVITTTYSALEQEPF
jgi:hypothetical protein